MDYFTDNPSALEWPLKLYIVLGKIPSELLLFGAIGTMGYT